MSPQHDYDLADASGAAFRLDLNNALDAIVSNNSGASEPATKFAYQLWYDTTNGVLKLRNAANTAWINLRDKVGRYQLDSGTANAMVITPEPAYTAYFTGMEFLVKKSAAANTDAATLKVNALAAVAIKDSNGQDPGASALRASELVHLAYNGSNFVLLSRPANIPAAGDVRLTKSGANLLLSPLGGNLLTIDRVHRIVADAGVTLAATGLTPGTLYYIYARWSGTATILEASVTAHARDANTGVEIKSGDATRTLVGMARVIAGPAWADTDAQRFVLSYFNRRGIRGESFKTTVTTLTNVVRYGEIDSNLRVEFLTWAEEIVIAKAVTEVQAGGGGNSAFFAIGFDGTTAQDGGGRKDGSRNHSSAMAMEALSEGYHYATPLGGVDPTGSGEFTQYSGDGQPGDRITLQVGIRG